MEQIDTMNKYGVAMGGGGLVIMFPPRGPLLVELGRQYLDKVVMRGRDLKDG